jgi:hypothetical protein
MYLHAWDAFRSSKDQCPWTMLLLAIVSPPCCVYYAAIYFAALLPVAYYTGEDFKPAKRVPARERTYWNG